MSSQRISEIRARCDAATPGEWYLIPSDENDFSIFTTVDSKMVRVGSVYRKQDGDLICNAHNQDIPYLLAEIERLQEKLQDREYQLSLQAMEQSRDEAIARAEQAEQERDAYKAALENRHEGAEYE